MEKLLRQRVIGQEDAITAVSMRFVARRQGCLPIITLDPSSSGADRGGQTELTKALAAFLFDDESALLRLDVISTWKNAVSRMINAPRICRL